MSAHGRLDRLARALAPAPAAPTDEAMRRRRLVGDAVWPLAQHLRHVDRALLRAAAHDDARAAAVLREVAERQRRQPVAVSVELTPAEVDQACESVVALWCAAALTGDVDGLLPELAAAGSDSESSRGGAV